MTKTREAASVIVTAAVTMVIASATLWPTGLDAVDQPTALRVLRPKMTLGTLQFTMEAAQLSTEPGAKPSVTLKVVNTGSAGAEAKVWLVVSATQPASPMSRRLEVPRTVWTHECSVHPAAGAAQTLAVPIDASLPEGQSITISMTDKEPAVPSGAGTAGGAAGTPAGKVAPANGAR